MWDVLESWSPADREQLAALLNRFVDDLRASRYRPAALRSAAATPAG